MGGGGGGTPRGPWATLLTWKQFQSINTLAHDMHDYTITLIKREKRTLSPLKPKWSLFFIVNLITERCFVSSFVEFAQWLLRRIKISTNIFTISLLSPFGKGHSPSFEQTWFHFTQGCFVPSLVEIGSDSDSWEEDF